MMLPVLALAWPVLGAAHETRILTSGVEAVSYSSSAIARYSEDHGRSVDFQGEAASNSVRLVADWVIEGGDNHGLPFIIVDKVSAKVFVFKGNGRLRAATLALLGSARGDDSAPGVGDRPVASIPLRDRTTPAGRFEASIGPGTRGDVLWIDYNDAIALHRVVRGSAGDHRLRRLATPSSSDKRISYGCINVPVEFYDEVVLSTLANGPSIVYILPEVKSLTQVFDIANITMPDAQ